MYIPGSLEGLNENKNFPLSGNLELYLHCWLTDLS